MTESKTTLRPYFGYMKGGWIYFAIGMWQPFKRFGASGWICLRPRWLWEKRHGA